MPLTATVPAPDLSRWIVRIRAAEIAKVHAAQMAHVTLKYNVTTQIIFGQRMYYLPDVERAAEGIAKMRAARDRASA